MPTSSKKAKFPNQNEYPVPCRKSSTWAARQKEDKCNGLIRPQRGEEPEGEATVRGRKSSRRV
jgi:hypothetical protein